MKEDNKEQESTQEVIVEQPIGEVKIFDVKAFQDSLIEGAEYFKEQYGVTRNSLNSDIAKELYKIFTKINQV